MRRQDASHVQSVLLLSLLIPWQFHGRIVANANTNCGQRPITALGTITYGRSSFPGQFPWHAALFHTDTRLSITYACGGFIVGEWVIITAAHCVTAPSGYQMTADELTVRVGLHDLLTLARHSQEHRVRTVHRHRNYTLDSHRHDLALLTLRTIIEFGTFVQPICLPDEGSSALLGLEYGTVSGWGLTEANTQPRTLQFSSMPLVSYIRCLESDRTLFGQELHEGMFCAGWENATNVCNGDSGGAFVANVKGSWTAFGIVSFTGVRENADQSEPFRCDMKSLAGFISVPKYISWIESVARTEGIKLSSGTPRGRICEKMCRRNHAGCTGEDLSYLTSVVSPSGVRFPPEVIDCYAVLISDRFLLAPARCLRKTSPVKQFIALETAGKVSSYRIKTFHQHPDFVNSPDPAGSDARRSGVPKDESNLALIELKRKVALSTCQFVCLWPGGADGETPPDIFLYSAVNVSVGDKSIEPAKVTAESDRPTAERQCYDELLAPMVMLQERDGSVRLVGIVLQQTCEKIRFIKVAPFLDWIEGIVWPEGGLDWEAKAHGDEESSESSDNEWGRFINHEFLPKLRG